MEQAVLHHSPSISCYEKGDDARDVARQNCSSSDSPTNRVVPAGRACIKQAARTGTRTGSFLMTWPAALANGERPIKGHIKRLKSVDIVKQKRGT